MVRGATTPSVALEGGVHGDGGGACRWRRFLLLSSFCVSRGWPSRQRQPWMVVHDHRHWIGGDVREQRQRAQEARFGLPFVGTSTNTMLVSGWVCALIHHSSPHMLGSHRVLVEDTTLALDFSSCDQLLRTNAETDKVAKGVFWFCGWHGSLGSRALVMRNDKVMHVFLGCSEC
ncbi:hypothetical protein RIF29_15646 [Crotalaria pallida]|uniref:Uncharacterized protein n=1 Tax=Crotalaria pallida TaxID=3830 RepID=A0AAN9FF64_CROPI